MRVALHCSTRTQPSSSVPSRLVASGKPNKSRGMSLHDNKIRTASKTYNCQNFITVSSIFHVYFRGPICQAVKRFDFALWADFEAKRARNPSSASRWLVPAPPNLNLWGIFEKSSTLVNFSDLKVWHQRRTSYKKRRFDLTTTAENVKKLESIGVVAVWPLGSLHLQ